MPQAGPPSIRDENRKFHRVVFTRTVTIAIGDRQFKQLRAKNLSLGGLFIEGVLDGVRVGDDCHLTLTESGRRSTLLLQFEGKITRVEDKGVGVEFTAMEDDSYMFLQTMLLYSSDDPLGVVADFLEDFSPGKSEAA
jgi:hypothetical protein